MVGKRARWLTGLLCLLLFPVNVNSHICVVLSRLTESCPSLDSKKQFRGISRRHQETGLWLVRKEHQSFFWNHKLTWQTDRRNTQSATGKERNERSGHIRRSIDETFPCYKKNNKQTNKKNTPGLFLMKMNPTFNLSKLQCKYCFSKLDHIKNNLLKSTQ